jgi:hypothetical protein
MPRLLMLTSALVMMCPFVVGQAQSAAISHSGAGLSASTDSLAQQIGWRGCGFWQAKCAMRWGPTWRFGRCMARHGCGVPPPPPPLPPK